MLTGKRAQRLLTRWSSSPSSQRRDERGSAPWGSLMSWLSYVCECRPADKKDSHEVLNRAKLQSSTRYQISEWVLHNDAQAGSYFVENKMSTICVGCLNTVWRRWAVVFCVCVCYHLLFLKLNPPTAVHKSIRKATHPNSLPKTSNIQGHCLRFEQQMLTK